MAGDGIIMVLGSPNDANGNLYSVALSRCRQAFALWKNNPDWSILLTGGYGEHFNTSPKPHAAYLKEFLVQQGVPSSKFLEFAESRNTLEDATLSLPIVVSHGASAVDVITSDYHVPRARFVFMREFESTSVALLFVAVPTDAGLCEFDLESQIEHERKSLQRLKEQ